MKDSKYQEAFYSAVKEGKSNIVLQATAGSGKTTSLAKAISFIPKHKSILAVAFNKSIAEEFKSKLPQYVTTSTIHSLGCSILKANGVNYKKVDGYKMNSICDTLSKEWHNDKFMPLDSKNSKEEQNAFLTYKLRIIDLANMAKFNLCQKISDYRVVANKYGIDIVDKEDKRAYELVEKSLEDTKNIDFNDMVYMPVIKKLRPKALFDVVFVDEAQDVSPLSQSFINLCVKIRGGLKYYVGDPHQSIYAFAGADPESFEVLKKQDNTVTLPLSISYRCHKQIVEESRKYNPLMEWKEGNESGAVNQDAEISDIKETDMVLCRNTAPLVQVYLELLKSDKKSFIQGNDMITSINNMIEKSKAKTCDHLIAYMFVTLKSIAKEKQQRFGLDEKSARKTRSYMEFKDVLDVVRGVVNYFDIKEIYVLKRKIYSIFNTKDHKGVHLSTIHKAKGLENERVFIYLPQLIPSKYAVQDWELIQETNLMYVAITRAKRFLGYIRTEISNEEDE